MQGKNQSVLLGALVVALLGVILAYLTQANQYVGLVACCVPGILGGLLAVWHFTDSAEATITSGDGAKLGAFAGALGTLIATLVNFGLQTIGLMRTPAEQMEVQRQQLEAQGLTADQINQALGMAEMFTSPAAMIGFALLGILIGALIGAVGGAIGASLFKKGGSAPEEGEENPD